MTAMSGPMLPSAQQARVAELRGVEEEGAGGDGDDAGGQAVEAVDEVDGVGHAHAPTAR